MEANWAVREMQALEVGDPRRKERVIRMTEQFASNPGASIPQACGSPAETKAAYRALSSETIPAEEIRHAHACATVERVRGQKRVLVVQDTTSLNYSTRPGIKGLGPLEQKDLRGLFVHTALVLSPEGVPLGVLSQQVWARAEEERGKRHTRRKRPVEEKESFRWLEMVDESESRLPHDVEAWVVGDRESDVFELFAMPRRAGLHLVVRSAQEQRKVESEEGRFLREAAERGKVLGEMEVEVPRSRKRVARRARLVVQAVEVKIEPPRHLPGRKHCPAVPASVVRVQEQGTTPEGEVPVERVLISTRPVHTRAQAVEIVEAYAQRWKVERYHYVLKSGCRIEDLQLENAARIERALAIYTVVAWRLLYMTYVARVAPEMPCTAVLEEDEWQALYVVGHGQALPKKPPSVREAVRLIAALGGFLGRKHDGEPGVETLWSGLLRLMDFTLALRRLRDHAGLVGNG